MISVLERHRLKIKEIENKIIKEESENFEKENYENLSEILDYEKNVNNNIYSIIESKLKDGYLSSLQEEISEIDVCIRNLLLYIKCVLDIYMNKTKWVHEISISPNSEVKAKFNKKIENYLVILFIHIINFIYRFV